MSDLVRKYIYKVAQSADNAILALQVIKQVPTKPFEEDIDERIKALEKYISYAQEVKRYLLYFKNQARKPNGSDFVRFP